MLQKIGELKKLLQIFSFISSEAVKSVRGDRSSGFLLTELYLNSLEEHSGLPRSTVGTLFPEVASSSFTIFGKAHPFITDGFADREAQTSSNETCALAAITSALRPKSILEIGTANGGTTLQFFLNAPNAGIWTVDIEKPKIRNEEIRRAFGDPRLHVVTGDSTKLDFPSLGPRFDLVFIDGGHDRETVRSDSLKAFDVLAPGGTILWHDYKPSFPDVFSVLNELSVNRPLEHIRGTSLACLRT